MVMKCEAFSHVNVWSKSGAARSHPGSIKADEAQNAKIQPKTATDPKGLIPSDKVLLGFGHWPSLLGNPITKQRTADLPKHPSSFYGVQQGLLCHATKWDMNRHDGYGDKISI